MSLLQIRRFVVIVFLVTCNNLIAQDLLPLGKTKLDIRPTDVIIWEGVQALQSKDGQFLVGLRLSTKDKFSIYKSRLEFEAPRPYVLSIQTEPPSRMQDDPVDGGQTEVYDGGDFELKLTGQPWTDAKTLSIKVKFLGCTHQICLMPYTQELKVPIYAADDSTDLKASATPGELKEIKHEPTPPSFEAPSSQNLSFEEKYAEQLKSGQLPWSIILLIIFVGGIATNLTPCVFPMIPITLRLLAQQGHARFTSTLFYALGIIVTYTGLGLIASLGGGIFGSVLASTWFNIIFAGIFILLGITMLGFGNLSKIQELGLQLGAGKSSYLNAFGMGAGAGLVAAPCTGPIMAALLTYATALHSTSQSAGLFLLYSSGFALPYVFLGLAAKRVVSYKVSPKVQVSVKILFAAAMFGLALYYLKNPAHDSLQSLQGHWRELFIVLLGISMPILIYIVRHSHFIFKKEVQLLPTLILGLGLFAGIQWASGNDVVAQLRWLSDLEAGYAEAARSHKPILIDGYADWCVACKKMDQTTYVEPEVISLLQDGWVLVKLDFTATTEASDALAQKFDMQGLPTMVMLPSDGDLSKSVKFAGYMTAERLLTELRNFKGK